MNVYKFLSTVVIALTSFTGVTTFADEIEPSEGGIIGTGIMGTIIKLGSIYVNGQHIEFKRGLEVSSALGPRRTTNLVPGETVIVSATLQKGVWQAEHIDLYQPIIGPVTKISESGLTVMGSNITLSGDQAVLGTHTTAPLKIGDWIAVSGLWRDNHIVASRVERVGQQSSAWVVGSYSLHDDGSHYVGNTKITGISPRHAKNGDALIVKGTAIKNTIEASSIAIGLFKTTIGATIVEGYLSQPDISGLYTVLGSGMTAFVEDKEMSINSNRGIFCATPGGKINRITSLQEELFSPHLSGAIDLSVAGQTCGE